MMVSATYPFYIITGLMVWLPGVALYAYLAHLAVAIIGLPLIFGHIFMATVNPEHVWQFSGMVTGWVDREWAKHHYRRWFRDRIEVPERQRAARELAARLAKPSRVKCGSCDGIAEFGSWRDLIQRSFQVDPLFCPSLRNDGSTGRGHREGHDQGNHHGALEVARRRGAFRRSISKLPEPSPDAA